MKPQDFIDKWLGWAKNKEDINDEILADLDKMNEALIIDGVVFNEAENCAKCLKPKRMKPNTIQMLCECINSEVELPDTNVIGWIKDDFENQQEIFIRNPNYKGN